MLLSPHTIPNADTHDAAMRGIPIVLSLCAASMALLCTARCGVGTTPDSASYLSAARSLLAGNGYLYFDGRVYTQWPPLFPTLLALFGLVGIEPLMGAKLLNSLAFGVIVLLSGKLFLRSASSRTFAIAGTLSIALSAPLLTVSTMMWSEPVFIALTTLFVLSLARFLPRPKLSTLLLASIAAALACLQRYAGVALIMAGSVLVLVSASKSSLRQRFGYAMVFGVVSATPLALWLLRNNLSGHTVGGHNFRPASFPQLVRSFVAAAETLAPWFFSHRAPNSVKLIGVGLIVMAAATMVVASRLTFRDGGKGRLTHIGTAVIVGATYFAFLVVSAAGLAWDPEQRLMTPLYVFLMLLVVTGAEAGLRLLGAAMARKWTATAGLLLCALWLLYPLTETRQVLVRSMRRGAAWQNSRMMEWLRRHPLRGRIYSNVPDAVYILTGAAAEITPHHYWTAADFASRMAEFPTPEKYVVWSHYLFWDYLYDLQELISRYRMEEIVSFPDGKIYRLLGEADGPSAFAVYRFWSPSQSRHLYVVDKAERNRLLKDRSRAWIHEGPAFYVFMAHGPETVPVYRFRSNRLGLKFYTVNERERSMLTADGSGWADEGIAFYVYPEKVHTDLVPVYRLWSDRLGCHFYTAREDEKAKLCDDPARSWTYEGIAWYTCAPL